VGILVHEECLRSLSDAESKVMSLQIKPFTVAVYSVGSQGGGRQLYAFDTTRVKKVLQDFVENLGGTLVDDWYEVATNGALDSVTAQAKEIWACILSQDTYTDTVKSNAWIIKQAVSQRPSFVSIENKS
jgi:hypothetical protein